MTKPNNKAFKDVLDKFIHIGNCYYNGKHYDNVLNIFNDLENEDQKALLHGVYYLFAVMEHGMVPGTNQPNVKPKPEVLDTPKESNEDTVTKELKLWVAKTLILMSIFAFFGVFTLVVLFGGSADESSETLKRTVSIFSLLLN